MVRHTTYITDELAGTGVVEALAEALRDKSERVRRRAMATLGELLFYIATQQQEPGGASVTEVSQAWGISSGTLGQVSPWGRHLLQHCLPAAVAACLLSLCMPACSLL
jgi:serine/threonine-protein kinase ULK4